MKKTILYKTLFFCWTILALTGCDLDLQKNYDYEPSVDDPYVKVTAWEYFQDHKDMFSELIAAIEYTGLKDYYTQTLYMSIDSDRQRIRVHCLSSISWSVVSAVYILKTRSSDEGTNHLR